MPLIKCGACGRDIWDQAQSCPYCGAPATAAENRTPQPSAPISPSLPKAEAKKSGCPIMLFGILAVVGVVWLVWFVSWDSRGATPANTLSAAAVVASPRTSGSAAIAPDPPPTPKERASFLLTYAKSDCKHPSSAKIARAIAKHPEWEDRSIEAIACGTITMGMSADEARASWGAPNTINSTQLAGSLSEQWVYPSDYIYFENGVVTSWQSSR